jgi:Tfp pilus assembly protein PilF
MFGRTADAESAFRAAIKDDPSMVSPYVNLANVRLLSGDPDGALAVLKQGLAQNGESALLNLLAARISADRGDAAATAAYFARVQKASPDLAGQYPELAAAAAATGTTRASKAAGTPALIWDGE